MATNLLEIVSLLEKINLATINNPKVLQNAVKAIEVISNSSNSSIRQKALIFQEKLKENPTFIELNKKEETKQAEIQQERSERLQEQLQAKRNSSAGEKLEREKKEEKSKEQGFKTLLNSGTFSNLPLWQQLEVLDYISTNFETLTPKQQNEAIKFTIEALKNPETAQKAYEVAKTELNPVNELYNNPPTTKEERLEKFALLQKEFKRFEQEPELPNTQIELAKQIKEANVTSREEADSHIINTTLVQCNYFLSKQDGYKNAFIERDKEGNLRIVDLVTGQELPMTTEMRERIEARINNNRVLKNEKCIDYLEAIKSEKIAHIKANFKPESKQALLNEINVLFDNMLSETEKLKNQGVYLSTASNDEILLQSKNYLFSDLLKSNPDLNMSFHIALKDFIRGNYEETGQKDAKSYSIFTLPFVQTLLKQGESGEKMLQEIIANQWFSQEQAKHYVQELKKTMQQPDFAEKVAQAEQLDQQKSIEEFKQDCLKEKYQDALMNYFYNNFRSEYEALWKTKCFDKSDPNYEMYKVFADGHIRDHLMKMDIKELKVFIEKETGKAIDVKKVDECLHNVGVYEKDKVEIDKLKRESELSEKSKQENIALTSENKKNEKMDFLTGYETKEQIEQSVSDSCKRLGYETANPSKPENQEQNNNSMQYTQPSSITSNT